MKLHHALWMSASVLALGWSGAAAAQTEPKKDEAGATTVQEVVVTAERRATNLQTTAIAATVLTGTELEEKGITNVDQLQFAMPAVVINNFGQGIDFNIRGIGKAEHNTQTTTGVITYRDGVATFPGYFQSEPYYDLASLEVLRGPQGTFVGQNATGGAVFVNSQNPRIGGGHTGYIQGQAGNYKDFGLQGAVNIPLTDTLAARISVNGEMRDSFYKITGPWTGNPGNLMSGSVRLGVNWAPIDAFTLLWKADYSDINIGAYPADPVLSPNDPFHITANARMLAEDRLFRTTLRADYTFANGIDLRSITGFQKGQSAYRGDLDGTSTGITTFRDEVDEAVYSQEFNLISPDTGKLTWIGGIYYQYDKYVFPVGQFNIGLPPGVFDYNLYGINPKQTAAIFGQATYKLTDSLQLQAGLRYSNGKTTNHVVVNVPQFGLNIPDDQTLQEDSLTGKLALNWTVNDHNFLYAFVATGFRPGGLNVPGFDFVVPPPFLAEDVTDYEAGWKAGWLDGRLRTQLSAYYNQYDNFQVIIGKPNMPTTTTELNVPSTTTIYGFEAQVEAVFGNLSFDGGLGWLHSELGAFYATDPRAASITACNVNTGPSSASCINLDGHEQTYAPNFTFNVGAQYNFVLSNSDTITPRINYGHVSTQWATLFENVARGDKVEERNLVNAQLAWTHKTLVATLYGTNLTDQHYVGAVNSGLRFVGPPRQYGVRILKTF